MGIFSPQKVGMEQIDDSQSVFRFDVEAVNNWHKARAKGERNIFSVTYFLLPIT
jgi:hypothetical protein